MPMPPAPSFWSRSASSTFREIQDALRAGEPYACQADAVTLSRLVRITENAVAIERVLTRAALPAARQAVQETVIDLATTLLRSRA